MVKKTNIKYIIMLLFIMFFMINLFVLLKAKQNNREFYKEYNYFDSSIYIKLYDIEEDLANKTFDNIDNIYKEYDELISKTKSIEDIHNLYYIINNNSNLEYINIDSKLYDLLVYGIDVYDVTSGLVDISKGSIYDLWDTYFKTQYSYPSTEELNLVNTFNINDIILKDNKIYNNNVNINVTYIIKDYMNYIITSYLKENNIDKYVVNIDNTIALGDKIDADFYSIGIEDPDNLNNIIDILYEGNKAISTIGGYQKNYIWNNNNYNYIINPDTFLTNNNFKSVTVISENVLYASSIAIYLNMVSLKSGLEYVKAINKIEAVWYDNDLNIIRSY